MRDLLHSRLVFVLGIIFVVVLGFVFAAQFFSPEIEKNVSKEESKAAQLSTKSEKEGAKTTTAEDSIQSKKTRRKRKARRHKTQRKQPSDGERSEVVTPSEEDNALENLSSLSGKVLDVWTGRAIGNAEISLNPYNIRRFGDSEWKEDAKAPEAVAKGRSLMDGTFIISNVPTGDYKLKAAADGYGEEVRLVWIPATQAVRVPKIYLEPSCNISGCVTNEKYQPIAKATVGIINGKRKARTRDDGSYTLEVRGRGNYHLLFEAKGYGFTRLYDIPAGSSDVNVMLYPGASISGKVIDARTRLLVAKARVYAVVQDHESGRGIDTVGVGRTDMNGDYTIGDLGTGYYMLWAKHSDMASSVKLVGIHRSQPMGNVDLELFASASISGRISQKESGNPVANIRVVAMTPHLAPYATTTSKADGSYQLTGLGPGEYKVGLKTSLYVLADESPVNEDYSVFISAGDKITDFDFIVLNRQRPGAELDEPAHVSGIVVDEKGFGVAGAKVLYEVSRSALSGKGGEFSLDNVRVEQITLWAEHPEHGSGWTTVRLKSGEEKSDLKIVLRPRTGSVSGRVVNENGDPVFGARVEVLKDEPGVQYGGTTDMEGRYRVFGEIPEGTCDVQVEKEGYETAIVHGVMVHRDELTRGVDFQLKSLGGHYIIGKVVDNHDLPIWGASVTATGPAGAKRTRSDFGGGFKIVGLKDGLYRITVTDWSVTGQTLEVEDVEVDTTDLKIAFKRSTGSIAGRVFKAGGQPVKKFDLAYFNQTAQPPTKGVRRVFSERGEFFIEGLEPGEYKIQATSIEEWLRNAVEDVVVEDDHVTSGVVIEIPNGGSISGTVVNAAGIPIEGAFVSADAMQGVMGIAIAKERTGKLPPYGRFVITDQRGIFRLGDIQEPGANIWAWHPEYAPRGFYVHVRNGETSSDVKIVLTEGGSVRGIVRNRFGTPLPNVDVYTRPPFKHVKTNANGSFRLEKLNAIEYWLVAWIRGVRRASGMAEVREGEEAYVELVVTE